MPHSLIELLPFLGDPRLPSAPVLVAAVLALVGLVLWGAGIRVARIMTAGLFGLILAAVGLWILPAAVGVSELGGAGIGLAAGVVIGIIAFRFLQAVVLALCLGVAVAGGYFQYEQPQFLENAAQAVKASAAPVPLAATPAAAVTTLNVATVKNAAGQLALTASARWQAIPAVLRWRMILAGAGAALAALIIAWLMPKHITWVMTALLGAGLVIVAGQVILGTYAPSVGSLLPPGLIQRLECAGGLVLAGMVMQRLFFWPGKSALNAATASA